MTNNHVRRPLSTRQERWRMSLVPDLAKMADRIVGGHIDHLRLLLDWPIQFEMVEEAIFDPEDRSIWVWMAAPTDPRILLRHEVIHALREAKVFTMKEWQVLAASARQEWVDGFGMVPKYADLYGGRFDLCPAAIDDLITEEAVAERFATFGDHYMHWSEPARRILRDVESGRVARRPSGRGVGRNYQLTVKSPRPDDTGNHAC